MLRVFIAEDERIIRETLRDTVPWTKYGYTFAGEAADGELALPLIREKRPDVLITDIRMPFMDGLDLSRLVLQEFPQTKIIIISGFDDFEYARQAVGLGVDRYLLKPITKNDLITVLGEVREKIESEQAQMNYLAQFRQEAQEYEQYARRNFFEQVVAGQLSVQQIYENAEKLDLDLRAQSYAIALFSIPPEKDPLPGGYSAPLAQARDDLVAHFLKYPEYILFRWNLTTYAVLIKGDSDKMAGYTRRCIDSVGTQHEAHEGQRGGYVAVSSPTQRLSALPQCFEEVSRLWAYRHIAPQQHILTPDTAALLTGAAGTQSLFELDAGAVDPALLAGVLHHAGAEEIPGFVAEYIGRVAPALDSAPFCQYLMLSVRFTAARFAASLSVDQQELFDGLDCLDLVGQTVTRGQLCHYMTTILRRAVLLRDNAAGRQYRTLLKQAVAYIDAHFTDEDLSLNRVAQEVNISANYLSAVFSQEIGATFVEYLTSRRMELARTLLRTTDQRSGEIAAAVGYRDPHYFSFLFKKTQGCTPRDYRAGKETP